MCVCVYVCVVGGGGAHQLTLINLTTGGGVQVVGWGGGLTLEKPDD